MLIIVLSNKALFVSWFLQGVALLPSVIAKIATSRDSAPPRSVEQFLLFLVADVDSAKCSFVRSFLTNHVFIKEKLGLTNIVLVTLFRIALFRILP